MRVVGSLGFTLVELVVTLAIVSSFSIGYLVTYDSFTSQSGLHLRASELLEYIQYAQDLSASSEILLPTAVLPTQGFQVVRLQVREGVFSAVRLEKVPGAFEEFATHTTAAPNNFDEVRQEGVVGSLESRPQPGERFFVDLCYIRTGGSLVRRNLGVTADGSQDASCSDSILCHELNSSLSTYTNDKAEKANFDVVFAIEQPTREVSVSATALDAVGDYAYAYTEPHGPDRITSNNYSGVRVVFSMPNGNRKSVDVYRTGLVSMGASNNKDGCPS